MKTLMLAGGGLMTAVVAVPLLALLAIFGVAGTALGCPPGGLLAATADVPARARSWIAATHAACPVLGQPWIAAVMAQESAFDPDAYASDVNGGTWGLFQLNAAVWRTAYGAPWSADRDRNGHPDVRDAAIHARVAGEYLCARLAGVRALRAAHPEWASTHELSELDALIVAHNAGESRLASYPEIPLITAAFLRTVDARVGGWSTCPGGEMVSTAGGTPRSPEGAIRAGLSMVGTRTGWYRLCDRLVCRTYGHANSGYPTAAAHWTALATAGLAHPDDRCPPPGSFLFWSTGAGEPGHVALVASADGTCSPHGITVVSNDVLDTATGNWGGIYHLTLARLETGFLDRVGYLGWTQPVCAGLPLPTDPVTS